MFYIISSGIKKQPPNSYCPKDLEDELKFDCFPENNANELECSKRGCCWSTSDTEFVPYCYYPSNFALYSFVNISKLNDNYHNGVVTDCRETYLDLFF